MTIKKIASLNIALYALTTLNPYFRWVLPNDFFYGVFIISTVLITFVLANKYSNIIKIRPKKTPIILGLLLFIGYFTLPFVHELRLGHFLWFIPFLLLLLYPNDIIFLGYNYFKKIIIWVSVFSLIIWFLNLLNLPIPYYTYTPDFRYNSTDNYRIYGLAVSLYRGSRAIGEVYGFERICGVFAEPGHFGIILGFILSIEKFDLTKKYNKIFIIVGVLTFSTAFYGIAFMGILYRILKDKQITISILYPLFIFVFVSSTLLFFGGDNVKNLILGDVFNNKSTSFNPIEIIDNRISDGMIDDYQYLSQTSNFLTGYGYSDLEVRTTNWRGLVFRFGVIGISIMVLFILSIIRKSSLLYFLLLLGISLLVLSHRSYLLYTPGLFFLLYFASVLDLDNRAKNQCKI